MPDINAFMNRTTLDGHCIICVDLEDFERAGAYKVKFGLAIMNFRKNKVIDLVLVSNTTRIGTH